MTRGLRVGEPTSGELDDLLARAQAERVTYGHVGSTLQPEAWPDREPHEVRLVLGRGRPAFDAAVAGLRRWACHAGIGAVVHPVGAAIEEGASVLVVLRVGPVRIVVPNRIVVVVDEAGRFGFAYGTLPGHQERGEEAFLVELDDDGTVWGIVRVDAVPETIAARAVGPAVGVFQRLAVRRYLGALADDVRAGRR